jgi:hypothetical protein
VSNVSKSLKVDFFTGQRVLVIIILSEDFDLFEVLTSELHLNKLTFSFRLDHFTFDLKGVCNFSLLNFFPVWNCILDDDLDWFGA